MLRNGGLGKSREAGLVSGYDSAAEYLEELVRSFMWIENRRWIQGARYAVGFQKKSGQMTSGVSDGSILWCTSATSLRSNLLPSDTLYMGNYATSFHTVSREGYQTALANCKTRKMYQVLYSGARGSRVRFGLSFPRQDLSALHAKCK